MASTQVVKELDKSLIIALLIAVNTVLISCNLFDKDRINESGNSGQSCQCQVDAYLIYDDHIPIYDSPNGKKITAFRFEDLEDFDFGKNLQFLSGQPGWLQISDSLYTVDDILLHKKWIESKFAMVGTTNYDESSIPLFKEPSLVSDSAGAIFRESQLEIHNCCKNWVFVKTTSGEGWLAPEYQCANEITNCN